MLNLIVNNSTSRLEGFTPSQFSAIRNELSYTPPSNGFTFSYPQALIDKKGQFATGLMERLLLLLEMQGWPVSIQDLRIEPQKATTPFYISLPVNPYPEQLQAVAALETHGRGVVVANTGFGKSIVVGLAIEAMQVPALVIVPNLNLKKQLTDSLRQFFPEVTVGGWGSTICVENIDALENKKGPHSYGLMVIDEMHHAAAKTYRKINKGIAASIYYRLGLTATFFRSQKSEDILMESVLSQVIYQVPHAHSVRRGLICPVEAYVKELPSGSYTGATWRAVYNQAVIHNAPRNHVIADLLLGLKEAGKSTLCLVKEIEHGEILSKLTGIPFANGESGDSGEFISKFSSRSLDVLIGTTGVLGEGVDTKPAEYIIIAGLGKAKNSFLQWVGRGFRVYPGKDSCKVILLLDKGHKWTRDHYNTQRRILKEEFGIEVVKI